MKECKRCYELLAKIETSMNENNHIEAIKYTEELLKVLKTYEASC